MVNASQEAVSIIFQNLSPPLSLRASPLFPGIAAPPRRGIQLPPSTGFTPLCLLPAIPLPHPIPLIRPPPPTRRNPTAPSSRCHPIMLVACHLLCPVVTATLPSRSVPPPASPLKNSHSSVVILPPCLWIFVGCFFFYFCFFNCWHFGFLLSCENIFISTE